MNPTATKQPIPTSSPKLMTSREPLRSEFINGAIIGRQPANRCHNLIATNLTIAIGGRIQRSSCEIYSNDMQVRIGSSSICFPDVVIVQGEPQFADGAEEILLNPTVLFEIFSSASKAGDRTEKLEGFLAIPKLKECLLVNQDEMRIEHYARQNPKQWIYRIYNERDDVVTLESISCKISMVEIYTQVRFNDSSLNSRAVN